MKTSKTHQNSGDLKGGLGTAKEASGRGRFSVALSRCPLQGTHMLPLPLAHSSHSEDDTQACLWLGVLASRHTSVVGYWEIKS